jgi:diguanylate cyclase (GGDEF)-like protein
MSTRAGDSLPTRWHQRLHAALMPDYNRRAAIYWWVVVTLGAVSLTHALIQVGALAGSDIERIVAGVAVAMLAGTFPVRIPRSKSSFAAGEIFIFLLLLMYGPSAAALASAGEAAVGSARTSKRWTSRIASPLMAALSMLFAGSLFAALTTVLKAHGLYNEGVLLVCSVLFAIQYFLVNTLLVTLVVFLKRSQMIVWSEWVGSFGWVGIASAGTASLATLLYLVFARFGMGVLFAATPIIAMLLTTLHYYFRQQEAVELSRKSRLEAAEREAAQAAKHAAELQHIAYHDSLTDLPNRSRFNERLQQAIERSHARARHQFAVLFIDFDRFKIINDSLGHRSGDEFLVQVSRRILGHVREQDLVARLGGDEFAILMNDIEDPQQATTLADRLLQVLREPLLISGSDIATSASIGITFSNFGYRAPDDVLRDADIAMYRAKTQGKARYAVFDASLHAQVTRQLHLENDLRRAIETGQLALAYQPIFRLSDGKLAGCEALTRWNHPTLGAIQPSTFIPIAEESGLISRISVWAAERSCQQLSAWRQSNPELANLAMHVNISGNDLCQKVFAEHVTRALQQSGVSPNQLTLEITENILMDRLESARDTMSYLRNQGIAISIDDFGTGYSSLSYLSRLPISSLKIDASFVQKLEASSSETEVVRAIVMLGRSLKKSVIAEGIETPAQLKLLRELGCELGQGYHLSVPLTGSQLEALPTTSAAVRDILETVGNTKVVPLFA